MCVCVRACVFGLNKLLDQRSCLFSTTFCSTLWPGAEGNAVSMIIQATLYSAHVSTVESFGHISDIQ